MPTDMTSLKTGLLSLLGAATSADGWEDALLSEALGQGLADANGALPPLEGSLTVTAAACEQDVNSLAPLQILGVAYPWNTGSTWRGAAVPWRLTAPGVIALEQTPGVGEVIRLRYRKRYTVSGLGGAAATTLPAGAERLLLLGAAGHAYRLRYRQLSRRPSSAPSELLACKELAEVYRCQFDELAAAGTGEPEPVWGELSE